LTRTVFAYGCSHTFGTGLPDTLDHRGTQGFPTASRYAYPQLLANVTGLSVENHGRPGASARLVHSMVHRHLPRFHTGDTVIIQWPNRDRFCVFSDPRHDILPHNTDPVSRAFYRYLYEPADQDQDIRFRSEHLEYLLGSRGVRCVQFATDSLLESTHMIDLRIDTIRTQFPLAADGWHPGPQAHQHICDLLATLL